MGMDKALLGKYPDENTLKHWEKKACVLFLSDVWGGKYQLLRSLLYMMICVLHLYLSQSCPLPKQIRFILNSSIISIIPLNLVPASQSS